MFKACPSLTEYKHILRVSPASFIKIKYDASTPDSAPSISKQKYWHLGSKKIRLSSFEEYKSRMYELTKNAVSIRADVTSQTIGAELSGGMDSGVIDILLNRGGHKCIYHSWSVDPNEVDYVEHDERLIVKDVCEQENIVCHFYQPRQTISEGSKMSQSLIDIGFPFVDDETTHLSYALLPHMNTFALCNTSEYLSNQGCNVVFTGHGGDEGISHRCSSYELYYNKEYFHYFKIMWSRTHGHKFRILKTLKKCRDDIRNNRSMVNQPFSGPFSAPSFCEKISPTQ